jgi:hypothetical protein
MCLLIHASLTDVEILTPGCVRSCALAIEFDLHHALEAGTNDRASATDIASDSLVNYFAGNWDDRTLVCLVMFLFVKAFLAEIEIWAFRATSSQLYPRRT